MSLAVKDVLIWFLVYIEYTDGKHFVQFSLVQFCYQRTIVHLTG